MPTDVEVLLGLFVNPHALDLARLMPDAFVSFIDVWEKTDPAQRGASFDDAWYWFSIAWMQPEPGEFPSLGGLNHEN